MVFAMDRKGLDTVAVLEMEHPNLLVMEHNYDFCMFDFEMKGISEAINWIVHDESLPSKREWRYLIYCTGLSHTKLCIGKWERRVPV